MADKKEEKKLYYHGLKEQKKLDVSKLKLLSILLSIIGVAVLLIAAQSAQAPLMKVSDVNGNYLMNYAVVRLSGTIASVPRVSTSGGKLTLTFTIDDGTGQMDVRAYSPLANRMIEKGLIPFPGDKVTVEVQLRVRETYTYAMLQYLDGLKFEHKLYSDNPPMVKKLTKDMAYEYVAVQGVLTDFSNVSSGYLLTVDTGTAPVTVLIPRVLLIKNDVSFDVGDTVYAAGIVYLYRGSSPEIVVRTLKQFNVTSVKSAPLVPLSEVKNHVGETVSVQGSPVSLSYEGGHYVLVLSDGTNKAEVILSREVLIALNPFELGNGSVVKVSGKVGDDGRLVGSHAEIVKPVETEFVKIGTLKVDMKGSIVAIRGNIDSVQQVKSNLKLIVSDGTGSIAVFIPSPVVSELSEDTLAGLKEGLGVEVAGYLEEYRGSPEIVVYTGDGIRALGEPVNSSKTQIPKVKASELGNYVGKVVDFVGSLQGLTYANGTYHLNVDGVDVSLSRDALMPLNPLNTGEGSVLVIRGLVKDAKHVDGQLLRVQTSVPPVQRKPGEITTDMAGRLVAVTGEVTGVANSSGNLKLTLGNLPVFIPRATASKLSYIPKKGDTVEVGGYVEIFKGKPEVVVFHPKAVKKISGSQSGSGETTTTTTTTTPATSEITVSELSSATGEVSLTVTWDALSYTNRTYYMAVHDNTGNTTLAVSRILLPNPLEAGTGSTLKLVVNASSKEIIDLNVVKAVPPKLYKTGEVTLDIKGKVVALNATVVSEATVGGSNLKLTLDDGSGAIAVFIPGGAKLNITEGSVVYTAGYVDEYKGSPELVVYTTKAVKVESTPSQGAVQEITVSELSSATGKVNLTVTWDALSYTNGTYYIAVHDDTGNTTLAISRDLLPNPFEAGTGSKIRITYDADLKKVVSLTVLQAVPSKSYKTGEVTLDLEGQTVIVEGTIKSVYEGSSFIKLTIDDGSGELVIFIPKSVAGDKTFTEGQKVKIGGYVTDYKGTVEVVPYNPNAIVVEG